MDFCSKLDVCVIFHVNRPVSRKKSGWVLFFSPSFWIIKSSSAKDELKQRSSELNYIKEPPGKSSGNSGFQGEEHVMNGAFPPSHV
jgi:hypothetical protein